MSRRRGIWLLAGLVLVLAVANYAIVSKEQVVRHGHEVLLELRPVDPRSLMAGDYMELRYKDQVFPDPETVASMPPRGVIVLVLDADGVGRFSRLDDGSPLREKEMHLRYKLRSDSGDLHFGAESFYFQEGQAEVYADARYGVLRVDGAGGSVLTGLADETRKPLGPP